MDYFEKYQKYKMKYLQLQKEFKEMEGGAPKIKTVLTINDPHFDGVMGDIDDNYSLLFLAQKFGQNLYIIIVDGKSRRLNKQYIYFIKFLIDTYHCNIYHDDEDLSSLLIIKFDVIFLCAPISQGLPPPQQGLVDDGNLYNFLKNYPFNETIGYLQGGFFESSTSNVVGFNYNLSYADKSIQFESKSIVKATSKFQLFKFKIISIPTTASNQFIPIDQISKYYKQNPMCIKWNRYQMEKILSMIYIFPAYGMWFDNQNPAETNSWKGSGNTYNTLTRIIASLSPKIKAELETIQIDQYMEEAYDRSLHALITARSPKVDEETRLSQFKSIKLRFIPVIQLAHYIYKERIRELVDTSNGLIKQLKDLPTFVIPDGMLKFTPILYDFNVTASIISMDISSRDVQSYLSQNKQFNLEIIVQSFNNLLKQFKIDFEKFAYPNGNPYLLFEI